MIWFVYNLIFPVVFLLLLPHFILRMRKRGGYARNFWQRLGRYSPETVEKIAGERRIWIHAVSVGELFVAFRFMDELRARNPSIRFFLTTTTSTGYALAEKRINTLDVLSYFPADFPLIMCKVINLVRPLALVLVESELWPNLIRYSRQRGIPVMLLNGRISERSFRGYRRIRIFTRAILRHFSLLCVQSEADGSRLQALGAPAELVRNMGSAKYDLTGEDSSGAAKARRVLAAAQVPSNAVILLGGSTWKGEEAALLDIYASLKGKYPSLFLVLVPRHFERSKQVAEDIEQRGLAMLRRSSITQDFSPATKPDVLLVDTTGELRSFYACADIIFVGKSLADHGGQNIIEPAFCAKPIVVGPNMENFPVITADFLKAVALLQVRDARELQTAIASLIEDPARRKDMGRKAVEVIRAKAGAVKASADLLEKQLAAHP
ncbi:MAG: 3-deoxy-D-manno-octulosonic acid transferase [Lentisphaerota bacterium]